MKSVLKVKSKNTQVTQEKVEPKYVEDKATEQYLDYINESGNVMRYNGDKYVNTGINLKGPRGAVGPRGLPGKDGITPHIGENGNWYIGEQDTGNKAAFDLTFTETIYQHNGYEYVDLGLPSGTLWATMNVGAENETDYGLYFQWGDTQGYKSYQIGSGEGKKYFGYADYKFNPSGDGTTFTKYNSTDGKTVLDLEDDAVRANWGGSWKMPTREQVQELINTNYCTRKWTTRNGVHGHLFTSVMNGNTLFIPASGIFIEIGTSGIRKNGCVWSSSRIHNATNVLSLIVNSSEVKMFQNTRAVGMSVRGVLDATEVESPTTTYTANRVIIPIDSSKNAATNKGVINTDTAVPYITDTENYLVIIENENLHSGTVIIEANLSGKGLCCPANIIRKSNKYYIYPSLPLDNIKDNLKDVILYCYQTEDYLVNAYKLWFDDFPEDKLDEIISNFDNWENFVADLIENFNENTDGANGYIYTGETFNWNGTEYYLWETDGLISDNKVPYIITDTINYTELYTNSLEADSSNKYCPYVAMLTDDMEAKYTRSDEHGDILIKVER